jgi:sialidase-1
VIESIAGHIIYENTRPHVHSRHGYFPGLTRLTSGELLCLFVMAEAFEAPNATTWITRSSDGGRTWSLQGPLYDKRSLGFESSDALKATLLRDGTLIAMGYRFHRHDPEQAIGIEETGGILPGDDIIAESHDEGRTWTEPRIIPRSYPELLEISGPCVELPSGDLVAISAPYRMPDGSNPSGQVGILLRSSDRGRTWDDRTCFFRSAEGNLTPLESRLCRMEDGRLVAIVWAYDYTTDRHHTNHVVVSHDDGLTWSAPIDTGHMGQASSVLALEGDRLLSIHAHRAGADPGLYVRLVDFAEDRWTMLEEAAIWGPRARPQSVAEQTMVQMFTSLRFGQPSLTRIGPDEYLAAHWSIEEGQGKIRAHRIRVRA